MLDSWLDYYRASLLRKCAGLSAGQLAERSCPPSPLSLAGLVRHMTEMERAYVHRIGEPSLPLYYCTESSPDGDFEDASAATAMADMQVFAEHCARSREMVRTIALDAAIGSRNPYTLRWVYLYLAKEYARHLGHADMLRERIDGATGE